MQHLVQVPSVHLAHLAAVDPYRGSPLKVQSVTDILLRQIVQVLENDVLLHREDGGGRVAAPSTLIALVSTVAGRSHVPLRLDVGGVEEQHVLLEKLGVSDEEALRAGRQRAVRLHISMAARDVAPEVVDVL